jgi:hypothetical protein
MFKTTSNSDFLSILPSLESLCRLLDGPACPQSNQSYAEYRIPSVASLFTISGNGGRSRMVSIFAGHRWFKTPPLCNLCRALVASPVFYNPVHLWYYQAVEFSNERDNKCLPQVYVKVCSSTRPTITKPNTS